MTTPVYFGLLWSTLVYLDLLSSAQFCSALLRDLTVLLVFILSFCADLIKIAVFSVSKLLFVTLLSCKAHFKYRKSS